jgi:hypothetical protein
MEQFDAPSFNVSLGRQTPREGTSRRAIVVSCPFPARSLPFPAGSPRFRLARSGVAWPCWESGVLARARIGGPPQCQLHLSLNLGMLGYKDLKGAFLSKMDFIFPSSQYFPPPEHQPHIEALTSSNKPLFTPFCRVPGSQLTKWCPRPGFTTGMHFNLLFCRTVN